MCHEGLFFSCHDSYIWRLLILLIAQNWWDWYDFFAASWKTIFSSLVEQELSENNLLSTIARLGKEWRVTVEVNPEFQYPISRILNQACSISNNLLSFILFASDRTESSTSPPGAWALDCQLPHRWDIFMFQQLFRFCELTITLRRLDLRDAGDYDPRQRIHRCADIGHQLLHLPPLLFILLFFLLQGELSGTLGWASPAYLSHVTQLP